MKLSERQIVGLRRSYAVCVRDACDRCGNLLGAVRWTRRGEPGEWCSELCRDGFKTERKRKRGGRPRLKLSAKGRASHRRKQVRDAVERHRLGVIKNCLELNETAGFADAFSRSGCHPTSPATATRHAAAGAGG